MHTWFHRFQGPIATFLAVASMLVVMAATLPAQAEEKAPPPETVDKVLSFVERGATTFAGTVREVVASYGDQAYELAKATARVSALSELVPGIVLVIFSFVAIWATRRCYKLLHNPDNSWDADQGWTIAMLLSGLTSIATLVIGAVTLSNMWAWVGVFRPEVYMVKMALDLLK